MQSKLPDEEDGDGPPYDIDLKQAFLDHFEDFEWDFIGLKRESGELFPIPATSTAVTAIFEKAAIEKIQSLAKELDAEIVPAEHSRQYPDLTLTGGVFGESQIAVDMKTARRNHNNEDKLKGRMTLGSYAGYFQEPHEDHMAMRVPYGTYAEHWVICFVHYWDPDQDSLNMVSETEVVADQKWKLASKTSGTGTTSHIGSVRSIPDLRAGDGAFDSREEFERYWRNYD